MAVGVAGSRKKEKVLMDIDNGVVLVGGRGIGLGGGRNKQKTKKLNYFHKGYFKVTFN